MAWGCSGPRLSCSGERRVRTPRDPGRCEKRVSMDRASRPRVRVHGILSSAILARETRGPARVVVYSFERIHAHSPPGGGDRRWQRGAAEFPPPLVSPLNLRARSHRREILVVPRRDLSRHYIVVYTHAAATCTRDDDRRPYIYNMSSSRLSRARARARSVRQIRLYSTTTSEQARSPAEFKHIIKRRKRN